MDNRLGLKALEGRLGRQLLEGEQVRAEGVRG